MIPAPTVPIPAKKNGMEICKVVCHHGSCGIIFSFFSDCGIIWLSLMPSLGSDPATEAVDTMDTIDELDCIGGRLLLLLSAMKNGLKTGF